MLSRNVQSVSRKVASGVCCKALSISSPFAFARSSSLYSNFCNNSMVPFSGVCLRVFYLCRFTPCNVLPKLRLYSQTNVSVLLFSLACPCWCRAVRRAQEAQKCAKKEKMPRYVCDLLLLYVLCSSHGCYVKLYAMLLFSLLSLILSFLLLWLWIVGRDITMSRFDYKNYRICDVSSLLSCSFVLCCTCRLHVFYDLLSVMFLYWSLFCLCCILLLYRVVVVLWKLAIFAWPARFSLLLKFTSIPPACLLAKSKRRASLFFFVAKKTAKITIWNNEVCLF